MESQRAKENAVRRQTAEDMAAFKQQQEDAEKKAKAAETTQTPDMGSTSWAVSRKRKKGKEDVFGGVKFRKAPSAQRSPAAPSAMGAKSQAGADAESRTNEDTSATAGTDQAVRTEDNTASTAEPGNDTTSEMKPPITTSSAGLGLAAYSSDEDD